MTSLRLESILFNETPPPSPSPPKRPTTPPGHHPTTPSPTTHKLPFLRSNEASVRFQHLLTLLRLRQGRRRRLCSSAAADADAQNHVSLPGDQETGRAAGDDFGDAEGEAGVISDLIVMLVEAARSTSYSSLLTLNVTNVIILAVLAFIFFSHYGFIGLVGRSFDGPGAFDVSALSSAVAAIAPGVRRALQTYAHLQEN
ncbi:uncharacterized protein LOC135208153 [Macrobrachium nipponense]|uniref:uncharacterized protein LOC135208153 n=1 Tax=Macrobrachium nipponense TaxID=159736 RepID=UPI0030C86168